MDKIKENYERALSYVQNYEGEISLALVASELSLTYKEALKICDLLLANGDVESCPINGIKKKTEGQGKSRKKQELIDEINRMFNGLREDVSSEEKEYALYLQRREKYSMGENYNEEDEYELEDDDEYELDEEDECKFEDDEKGRSFNLCFDDLQEGKNIFDIFRKGEHLKICVIKDKSSFVITDSGCVLEGLDPYCHDTEYNEFFDWCMDRYGIVYLKGKFVKFKKGISFIDAFRTFYDFLFFIYEVREYFW